MLFMGPDRVFYDRGTEFYGMDINTEGALNTYCVQQMKGSAYWMEKGQFQDNLRSIFAQLSRAGIRIVVGHGHGPSTNAFQEMKEEAEEKYGLELVDFGQVKENESNLIGIAGRHPVRESSVAYGNEILEYTMKTLISGIEKEYKILKES